MATASFAASGLLSPRCTNVHATGCDPRSAPAVIGSLQAAPTAIGTCSFEPRPKMRRSRRSASAAVPTLLVAIPAGGPRALAPSEHVSVPVTFVAHCCRHAPPARHDHRPHTNAPLSPPGCSAFALCSQGGLAELLVAMGPITADRTPWRQADMPCPRARAMPAGQSHARGPEPCPRVSRRLAQSASSARR